MLYKIEKVNGVYLLVNRESGEVLNVYNSYGEACVQMQAKNKAFYGHIRNEKWINS